MRAGQFLQNLVAHVMAVRVIHRLEEIHVDGKRRKRLAAIDGMFDQMAEMGFHVAPVVKAGERVGHRHFNGGLHADAELLGIAGAPDLRVHPGHQLLPVDGADEIVVHAHVEGPHEALLVVGRHHDEDGNLPGLLQRFQLRAQAQAIELLGIEIDDDQLIRRGTFGNRGNDFQRINHRGNLVLSGERHAHPVNEGDAAVDHQDISRARIDGDGFFDDQAHGLARFGPGPQFVRKHLEAHQAFDAAKQGHVIHRLGEEIIGAGFQAAHPVFQLVKGGHHDDRNMLRGGIGLDAPAHFDAVDARHHHVEKHDVGLGALHGFQRIHAIHGGDDFEILG